MPQFGKHTLGIYMMDNGISQNQLSRYIGVSNGHLSDMINGRRKFLIKHKTRIAQIFNRTVDQIEWPR